MTPLTGDQMKRAVTLCYGPLKLIIFLSLNIDGNIWDNVSTQLNKIYNIGLVIFRNFYVE